MTLDEIMNLEREAQKAAEQRLSDAHERFYAEQEDGLDVWEGWEGGAFCGCDTCIVREVIDAAWPYLERLGHVLRDSEQRAELEVEEA